jgi:hypothetical protein
MLATDLVHEAYNNLILLRSIFRQRYINAPNNRQKEQMHTCFEELAKIPSEPPEVPWPLQSVEVEWNAPDVLTHQNPEKTTAARRMMLSIRMLDDAVAAFDKAELHTEYQDTLRKLADHLARNVCVTIFHAECPREVIR